MIQAESDAQKRDEYLHRLMELPNQVLSLLENLVCPFFFALAASMDLCHFS